MENLSQLRVAIVHYWLTGMRGGEKVIEALCEMFPQADIYTHVVRPEALSEEIRRHAIHTTFIQNLPGSVRHYQHYLPLMPLALEQLDLRGYDLIVSSESGPAKGGITRTDALHICYCHSPMRYLWDYYQDYLDSAGFVTRLFMRPFFYSLRQWDFASAQRVDHVVANSRAVQQRVRRWWGRESVVIHPPVDVERFFSPDMKRTIPSPPEAGTYYLCLGELVGYKRVDLAVVACTRSGRQLIVAGDGAERKRLEAVAGPTVRFVGRVDNGALPDLYAGCKAFLLPGEEDFGITPVEAMAAGRPVVAYGKGGALDSIVDGKTGMFFERQTADSLAEALDAFENRSEPWDSDVLREHARTFSKHCFQERMARFVTDMLSSKVPV